MWPSDVTRTPSCADGRRSAMAWPLGLRVVLPSFNTGRPQGRGVHPDENLLTLRTSERSTADPSWPPAGAYRGFLEISLAKA